MKKLLCKEKLTPWDFITIGIWLMLSLYFFVINEITFQTRKPIVIYSFCLYFFTLGFNYKSLRNLNCWFVWMGISLVQTIIYYKQGLHHTDWPAIRGLRNFWMYLILFQILRWISLKLQKKEFVALAKLQTDLFDDRKFTFLDGVLYLPAIFFLFYLQII